MNRKVLESVVLPTVIAASMDGKLVKNDIKFTAMVGTDALADVTGKVKTYKTIDILVGQMAKQNPYATTITLTIDVSGLYQAKTPTDPVAAATAEKTKLVFKKSQATANLAASTAKLTSIAVWENSSNPGQKAQFDEVQAEKLAVADWLAYLNAQIALQDAVISPPSGGGGTI